MKRLIFLLTLITCLLSTANGQIPNKWKEAPDFSEPNKDGILIHYKQLSEKEVAVTYKPGHNYNADTKLVIPNNVFHNGTTFTVTEIADDAFKDLDMNLRLSAFITEKKSLEIQLPNSIVRIGKKAFANQRIIDINIPLSVKSIGEEAFKNTRFNYLALNEGLEEIGERAFFNSQISKWPSEKYSLYIPHSVKNIGKDAFLCQNEQGKPFMFKGRIISLPYWITPGNSSTYGISPEAVIRYNATHLAQAQHAQQPQVIYVQQPVAQTTPATPLSTRLAPSSDVDKNIPEASGENANTFAIIIANENYLEETAVQYALNDGQMFKTYCQKVLGLPEDNIHYRENATLNNMLTEVDWIAKVARAYNGEASLIVYYAGHGIPDEASGSSYLLPVDGIGNNLRTGYSLAELYKTLGALPARSVTVFMDACFSGAKRGEGMLASARGVAIKAKPEAPKGNMVVFSAAQGDETAYPYEDKGHGLFTYFLLKKLQETKGQVSLGELAQYVQQQVSRRSIVTNGKSQTPCVVPSESVVGTWKEKKLK